MKDRLKAVAQAIRHSLTDEEIDNLGLTCGTLTIIDAAMMVLNLSADDVDEATVDEVFESLKLN